MFKYLRFFTITKLILFFLCCSSNDIKNLNKKSTTYDIIKDLFTIKDSCDLKYPSEAFPKYIQDVSITGDYIYVISNTKKYPLVKFYKNGNFAKLVSRIGLGPGEIKGWNHKIDIEDSLLVIFDGEYNRLLFYKNDQYYFEKSYTDDAFERLDVIINDIKLLNNDYLLVSCCYNANYNLLLMKINNKDLKIVQRLYKLPLSSDLPRILGSATHHGLVKCGNIYLSHFSYPPHIIESTFIEDSLKIIKVMKNINFHDFQRVDSSLSLKTLKVNSLDDYTSIYYSISKLRWVVKMRNYYVGLYTYYPSNFKEVKGFKLKDAKYKLFILHNNKIIHERKLSRRSCFIPYNGEIIYYFFPYKDKEIVRLYFLTINEKNPIFSG